MSDQPERSDALPLEFAEEGAVSAPPADAVDSAGVNPPVATPTMAAAVNEELALDEEDAAEYLASSDESSAAAPEFDAEMSDYAAACEALDDSIAAQVDAAASDGEAASVSGNAAMAVDSGSFKRDGVQFNSAEGARPRPRAGCPANRPPGTTPLKPVAAPPVPPTPGKLPPPVATPPRRAAGKPENVIGMTGGRYGAFLRDLRLSRNLSYAELENQTKIVGHFLEALENEELKKLPPPVYIIAYIRTLLRFYNVAPAQAESWIEELKQQISHNLPDEILSGNEFDNSVGKAELRRLKFWLLGIGTGLALVIVVLVLLLSSGGGEEDEAVTVSRTPAMATATATDGGAKRYSDNRLYSLMEAPALEIVELPVAR